MQSRLQFHNDNGPPPPPATQSPTVRYDRQQAFRILFDLLIFIVLVIPVIVCEFGIEPVRRGFFCDDDSIRYPYHGNTVTPVMLGLMVGLLPLLFLVVLEFLRFQRRGRLGDTQLVFGWSCQTWLLECLRQMWYFCVGVVITFDATEVGKYTIGRLRPHFMAVCQPRLVDGTTCSDAVNQHRYIERYVCQPALSGFTAEDVRQARLSFPSGHSSLAWYTMIYLTVYMHQRLRWRSSKLWRHFLQFILIIVAWYTALSRVMDNWHHWSDVLVGSLIGCVCALLTARFITKLYGSTATATLLRLGGHSPTHSIVEASRVSGGNGGGGAVIGDGLISIVQSPEAELMDGSQLKLSIPRAETTTTLQDVVISSTPPPYSMEEEGGEQPHYYQQHLQIVQHHSRAAQPSMNGFTNIQYSTKV